MHSTTTLSADIDMQSGANELIPSVAVDRVIAQRNSGVDMFMQGVKALQEAQKLLAAAAGCDGFSGMAQLVESGLRGSRSAKGDEAIRRSICLQADRNIWQRLMEDTGMLTLMSAAQKKQWRTDLYSDNCPEISLDNVLATFRQLNASKAETFEQGVIDVFRNLSWDYRTNNPRYLGKRIIIDGVLDNYQGKLYSVRSYGQDRINDLARPFWLLDGKTVPDFRVSEGVQLSDFIQQGGVNSVGELLTCDYFTLRVFKKGSAHITFTRPDLVDRVNDIIARHYPGALPPAV
ncbi:DUF4942 domain-containing protein [Salmonella enterica]|uniref:DUF4942 domain-containing protein n=2 Tax=Salmonella enterica TaxID=28901 RepID=A0A5V3YU64_SALER|nr:DUF4942 domain-containing protein [Salmonella enterica]EBR8575382.1 DUF4942 domain-containing protein [Salmonella enterica subsp. enterica serovar Java]EBW7311934.1 DUF4942 domain-containing protein [Salmonella enterica subsp. enterica serovar Enteritidis]EBW9700657.1 DUF4942 domain-containing protein [Salmonella enterica subsp. enterica serovar Oranienburg]EKN5804703.1 DUF4942 domain-containing protein [Salmonella enterica subsp. enterica]